MDILYRLAALVMIVLGTINITAWHIWDPKHDPAFGASAAIVGLIVWFITEVESL